MGVNREQQPKRRLRIVELSCGTVASNLLLTLPNGKLLVLFMALGMLLLIALLTVVALGAAFASEEPIRRSAGRTLQQILGLVPWYTSRR
ncbi:hypothetical protein [Microbispora rosea]|uniref:hypothetical protein n=1 Tax=Microbispora rosea TaxID=58117 RepID=UPI003D946A6A